MELPVSSQALLFAQGVALGLMLCAGYDLLRALRRLLPGLTLASDVLFGLSVGVLLLLFALLAGKGELRLFVFVAVLLAAIFYFLALSPFVLRCFSAIFAQIGKILRFFFAPVRIFFNFLKKILKTLFASCKKWFKMSCKSYFDWKHAQLEGGKHRSEIRKVVAACQAGDSDPRCVRYGHAGAPARTDRRENRRGRRPDKLHRKHAAGK